MEKCPDTKHNYLKFDDATVVCTKCADQRVVDVAALIAKMPQPVYLPCPYPHYHPPITIPTWQPNWWWAPTTSPAITYGSSTAQMDDNVQYTLT